MQLAIVIEGKEVVTKIKGLKTESQRILEYLFDRQENGE